MTTTTNSTENESNVANILDNFVEFRRIVRNNALKDKKDLELLEACDSVRKQLSIDGVDIKV